MEGEENNTQNNNAQNATGQNNNSANISNNSTASIAIDYDKIQGMIDGRTAKTEENILKDYFQKQGLSAEEAKSAINTYKAQKQAQINAQNENSINLQNENSDLKNKVEKMEIENIAMQKAMELGIDAKTIPYLIKIADLSTVLDNNGKVSDDAVKNALNKVLEDLPQLKPQSEQNKGFQKIGADSNNSSGSSVDAQLDTIFGA